MADPGAARAAFLISRIDYAASGPTESAKATFATADGGVTSGLYDGYVEVTVSGSGMSLGARLNDAFYVEPGIRFPSYYQLAFGTTTLVRADPAQDAARAIVYDVDAAAAVSGPYVPAWRPSHTYSFVLDTGASTPKALHFGVSDDYFADNGGGYVIDVTPLVAPEPGPLLLLLGGLLCVGWARLRRR